MTQPRRRPQIEMLIDGTVIPPTPSWPLRLAGAAIVVAVLAGVLALVALTFWIALALIPVALVAGLLGWAALRFHLWRARRSGDLK